MGPKEFTIDFEFDDGYGGIYPISAKVRFTHAHGKWNCEVIETDGPTDQDGGEIERLWDGVEVKTLELAWRDFEYFERGER